jgi:hypothetical protein
MTFAIEHLELDARGAYGHCRSQPAAREPEQQIQALKHDLRRILTVRG